jgi:hypothetical protein
MVHFNGPPDLAIDTAIGTYLGRDVVDADTPAQSAGRYGAECDVVFVHFLNGQMVTLSNCYVEAKAKAEKEHGQIVTLLNCYIEAEAKVEAKSREPRA